MPLIFAKSKMDSEHVEVKEKIGCDGIEYQMLASDFNGKQELISPEKCLSVVEAYPAHAIHLPMNNCNVEDDIAGSLEYVTQLAEHSALIWRKTGHEIDPIVVLHNEQYFDCMDRAKRYDIVSMFSSLLDVYPHVNFVIENTTPFRWLQKMSTKLSSGYFDSPVLLANYLRNELETDRIGTCLDTCHVKIASCLMGSVLAMCPEIDMSFSVEQFFEEYRDTCKLFHFASFDGSGYGDGHATPYTESKVEELEREIALYRKLGYGCPVTLEINEKDLLVSDRYAVSRKNFLKVWEQTRCR